MYEQLDQPVSVVAVFGTASHEVRLCKIKYNGREYAITKIGYVHKQQKGRTVYHVFSATDGKNFFELILNTRDLSWKIGRAGLA